jgi:hypothetical protein
MLATYQVAVEQDSILVRLPAALFDRDELIRFLDYLEVEAIRRRSQLSRADADALVAKIDRACWRQLDSPVGAA